MRVVSKTLAWRDAKASVLRWFNKKALRCQGTAKVYLDDLYLFWRDRLNSKFRSIDEWLHSVKEQQESKDYNKKVTWQRSLKSSSSPTSEKEARTSFREEKTQHSSSNQQLSPIRSWQRTVAQS